MNLLYPIQPRRVALALGIIALLLALQSLVVEYMIENVFDSNYNNPIVGVMDLFSINAEKTIPTWYATTLLLVASVVLAVIARDKLRGQAPYARHWAGLSVIFLYLSLDEGASIHELLSDPLEAAFGTSGFLAFGWVIAGVVAVLIFGLVYLRFLLHLPPATRNGMILAGMIYVGGAIVIESISANQWDIGGGVSFPYLAIATVEELMEKLGVVLFIYTLLVYSAPATVTLQTEAQPAALPLGWVRPVLTVIAVLAVVNVGLFLWAEASRPLPDEDTEDAADALTPYEQVAAALANEGGVVAHLPGRFGFGGDEAPPVAVALLGLYDNLMAITFPAEDRTIFIAGTFDQTAISAVLAAHEAQYILYDTQAVRRLLGQ